MDSEAPHEAEKPLMINCPPVILPAEELPENVPPFVPPKTKSDEKGAKESKEFLDGLKKDSKAELGVEGGQPIKSRAIDKEKAKFPTEFPKFMAFCKAKLEEGGLGDLYKDAFHLHSCENVLKLAHSPKKQVDMRRYLEALLEEKELV